MSSGATLLVKSVSERLQASNTWSATWVSLFQCSGKSLMLVLWFLLSQAFYLPQTLECSDSSMACWEIEFLPLIPSCDLHVKKQSQWMSSDFSWNNFCFDVQQAWHCTELAHNRLKKKCCKRKKTNNCWYLFFWAFLSIKDTLHLVSKILNCSIFCYRCECVRVCACVSVCERERVVVS